MAGKVKSVLVSQPKPTDENSPYYALAKKYSLKIDFRNFIQIEGVTVNEYRKQGLDPVKFTAIILTSKNAVDHFFRIVRELKTEMPPDTKYFCVGETTALYLQKYIVVRKRKLYVGEKTTGDLIEIIKKHKTEKFLYPCSDIHRTDLTDYMHQNSFDLKEAIIYHTIPCDLADLKGVKYDLLCFFSPSGIDSLFKNFPEFVQADTRVAVFGPTTAKAAIENGLRVDIEAPLPNMPSLTGAIELYLKNNK